MALPTDHDVDILYLGHHEQFDAYVHSGPKKLKREYPQINCAVVMGYIPGKKKEYDEYSDTALPGVSNLCTRVMRFANL